MITVINGKTAGKVDVVLGLQFGDEGKGRIVDNLSKEYQIVARFNGGPNAGHTIVRDGIEFRLHQLPSGIIDKTKLNIIGNGGYVNPLLLLEEIEHVANSGVIVSPKNLVISSQANLILPHHIELDVLREQSVGKQGSTKNGIAQTAADKYGRQGLKVEDLANQKLSIDHVVRGLNEVNQIKSLQNQKVTSQGDINDLAQKWFDKSKQILTFAGDTQLLIQQKLAEGNHVLAEGAQSIGLGIEGPFYPYTSSSHSGTGGVLEGLGVNYTQIGKVIGVFKAIKSRVGGTEYDFITEIKEDKNADFVAQVRGEKGKVDSEFGSTTGRPRRVGYLDLVEIATAIRLCGVTELAITKLDHLTRLGKSTLVAVNYKDTATKDTYEYVPNSKYTLKNCQPVYKELATWDKDFDFSNSGKLNELPEQAQAFIDYIHKYLNKPVKYIGVGPGHDQLIKV